MCVPNIIILQLLKFIQYLKLFPEVFNVLNCFIQHISCAILLPRGKQKHQVNKLMCYVLVWIDGKCDNITVCHRGFSKSYILKYNKIVRCHCDSAKLAVNPNLQYIYLICIREKVLQFFYSCTNSYSSFLQCTNQGNK